MKVLAVTYGALIAAGAVWLAIEVCRELADRARRARARAARREADAEDFAAWARELAAAES